jgi:hypothetical protein
VTNAVVFASRFKPAIAEAAPDALLAWVAEVKPSHPCAACTAFDTALHPFDDARTPTVPAIAANGTNLSPPL